MLYADGQTKHKSVAKARNRSDLHRILLPHVNVCVWRRSISIASWLREVSETLVWDRSVVVAPGQDLRGIFPELSQQREARLWATDVKRLLDTYRSVTGAEAVQVSLVTVHTNKCRKFHADFKPLRMVCTYAGPGTEWVEDRSVNHDALLEPVHCFDTANARIVPRASSIEQARSGDVVMLKGALFSDKTVGAAIHRSPQIEGTGVSRIVVTLDTP